MPELSTGYPQALPKKNGCAIIDPMILHDGNAILLYILLQIVIGIVAGYVGARFRTWTLQRYVLEIDYRLTDLIGRLNREIKIRAGDAGRNVRTRDREFDAEVQAHVNVEPAKTWPPWKTNAEKNIETKG